MDLQIKEKVLTHAMVRNGFDVGMDSERIGEYTQLPGVVKTFVSNPRIEDEEEPLLFLEYLNDDICGRMFYFPTKIKIGESVENSLGASSLLVSEKAREYSVGANLMMYPIKNKYKKYLLYAGVSKMAEPLYHKLLKFEWFSIPCLWQPRTCKFIFQTLGLKGRPLKILTSILDLFIKPTIKISCLLGGKQLKRFTVKKLDVVPQWIEDIVMSDSHKYAEYHDKQWFEWVLSNNFFQDKCDLQGLYGFYKENNPVGFVLIKERNVCIPEKNIDSVVFGTIIEWGSVDENILTEYDINRAVLSLYSKNVQIAQVITANHKVLKSIKKYCFIKHGNANIAFRDLTKELNKDYKNIENWRIRSGYSDVPFY